MLAATEFNAKITNFNLYVSKAIDSIGVTDDMNSIANANIVQYSFNESDDLNIPYVYDMAAPKICANRCHIFWIHFLLIIIAFN